MSDSTQITFKTSRQAGNIVMPTYPFLSCVQNYLELMSLLTKKPVFELEPLLVLPNEKDEKVELVLKQADLFAGTVANLIRNMIIEVGKSIFDKPDDIDYSVFEKLNIEPKQYNKVVEILKKDRSFYKALGLKFGGELKLAYLQKVTPYLKDINANTQLLVDIAGVMNLEPRRHASFFVYRDQKLQLKHYKKKAKILVCEIDSNMAKALLKLIKDKENGNGNVSVAIFITIKKKAEGNVHDLVSIDDDKQQFKMACAEKLNISN